jgi:hypothetical protein
MSVRKGNYFSRMHIKYGHHAKQSFFVLVVTPPAGLLKLGIWNTTHKQT